MKIVGGVKVALAQLGPQPNKRSSMSMLLDTSEVPGSGWRVSIQQNLRAHAFKEKNLVTRGAKTNQSTTSRKLFESDRSSKSLLVEVTPLATEADAESWSSSSSDRTRMSLSNVANLQSLHLVEGLALPGAERASCFEYTINSSKGVRTSLAIAANYRAIYLQVTGSSLDESWTWGEVIDAASAQVRKISRLLEETAT
ncbi:MAG: hypothetical protein ACREGR_00425 [Minisyncoccia bacterium]